jgi:hypothetical protein
MLYALCSLLFTDTKHAIRQAQAPSKSRGSRARHFLRFFEVTLCALRYASFCYREVTYAV